MNLNSAQIVTGILLLGSALAFGVGGLVVHVQAGEPIAYQKDNTYIEECGACHLDYVPGLLPPASWRKMMTGLEDHFGEDASLDEETADYIAAYLDREALRPGKPTVVSEMLRNLPADPPLRITELPAFLAAHEVVGEQLDMETFPDGFLSPCRDCHRQAHDGIFEKDQMHPGYGPSIWGGQQPEE